MAHTDTNINNLKINRGTYQAIQQNIDSIGENELIITTDKAVPVPSNNDMGKVISVDSSGEYTLSTPFTNPMTTSGDIIIGDTNGTPIRKAKGNNGQVLSINTNGGVVWANNGVTEIDTQYIRITNLNAGVYKLTYTGVKYIYYSGMTSTLTHTVAGSSGAVILVVSKSTQSWYWWYINGDGSTNHSTLYYGFTSSSGGATGSKKINDISTAPPTQLYHHSDSFKNTSSYAVYRYQMLVFNGTGLSAFTNTPNSTSTSKTQLSAKYYPNSPIFYYGSTTAVNNNSTFTGPNLLTQYYDIDLRYSFNITTSTLNAYRPVYLKMSVNNDGTLSPVYSATSAGHPLVQTLPSTDDGYVYVYLGTTGATSYYLDLEPNHPCFWYKDGKILPYGGGAGGGNPVQDLTENIAGTVASADWTTLKTSHYHVISTPTMTGLDSTYEFVNIKLIIDNNNQYVKLNKNTTNKYSGMFYIEESTNLYEVAVYYNGTNIILRCATVY